MFSSCSSFSDGLYTFLLCEKFATGTIQKTYVQLITILNHFYERREELYINLTEKFRSKLFKHGEKAENEAHPLSYEEFEILVKHDFEKA